MYLLIVLSDARGMLGCINEHIVIKMNRFQQQIRWCRGEEEKEEEKTARVQFHFTLNKSKALVILICCFERLATLCFTYLPRLRFTCGRMRMAMTWIVHGDTEISRWISWVGMEGGIACGKIYLCHVESFCIHLLYLWKNKNIILWGIY